MPFGYLNFIFYSLRLLMAFSHFKYCVHLKYNLRVTESMQAIPCSELAPPQWRIVHPTGVVFLKPRDPPVWSFGNSIENIENWSQYKSKSSDGIHKLNEYLRSLKRNVRSRLNFYFNPCELVASKGDTHRSLLE